MKRLLWNYKISPSMSKTAAEINNLFELIFGVNGSRDWRLQIWKMDCTYSVPEGEKKAFHSDYKFLLQAVSMGSYFDTEILSYSYFYILYTALRHNYKIRIASVVHKTQKKGANYTADCSVVEDRCVVCLAYYNSAWPVTTSVITWSPKEVFTWGGAVHCISSFCCIFATQGENYFGASRSESL